MASELSDGTKKVLYDCFKFFDKSGDGVIDGEELPEALRFAGINPTNDDIPIIIKLFDTNRDGKLQIEELVENWDALCQHSVNGEELLSAFHKLDTDGDGFINIRELTTVLMKKGEKWSPEEAKEFYDTVMKYDINGDGKFSYPEFVAMWAGDNIPTSKD